MGLKDALKKLENAVEDLTSLHVQTLTGEFNTPLNGTESFSNIRQAISQAKAEGKVRLVAETLAQFDGDSYNFLVADLESVPKAALEIHKNAVESGINTRMSLLNLFKDLLD